MILDTSVMVAIERELTDMAAVISADDDAAIAAITAAELLVGVRRADERHRQARSQRVEGALERITIEAYDLPVARHHSVLLAENRRRGSMRGLHDLLIAATAVARNRTVVTLDGKGFEGLPGVRVRTA